MHRKSTIEMSLSLLCLVLLVATASAQFGDESTCKVEQSRRRPGGTFNDGKSLIFGRSEECCTACQVIPECKSWTRDRRTGECFLKSVVPPMAVGFDFDSGVIGGEVAPDQVPADTPCYIESGTSFVGNNVFSRVNGDGTFTSSADECCNLCKLNLACFSWTRDRFSGMCSLLGTIPPRVFVDNFDAGTII